MSEHEKAYQVITQENKKLWQENKDLRAKLDSEQEACSTLVKRLAPQVNYIGCTDRIDELEQERDNLQAAYEVVRGALEEANNDLFYAEEVVSDIKERFFDYEIPENTTDKGGKGMCMDLAAHLKGSQMGIDQALSTTPAEAGERVQGLVKALESTIKAIEMCHPMNPEEPCVIYKTWVRAKDALAKFRGGAGEEK